MTYTAEELKAWFNYMKEKYPNCKLWYQVDMVEYCMFGKYADEKDKLQNFVKRLDKSPAL